MLEILQFIQDYGAAAVREYGLIGIFLASAIGSTIFVPLSAELTFPILVAAQVNRLAILVAATVGALLGTLVNYWLGYRGVSIADKYLRKEDLEKAHKIMNRYGWVGVMVALAVPVPLPIDPLTILCGITRMDLKEFIAAVVVGKAIKYALVLEVVGALI